MEPIEFKEQNYIIAKDQPEYKPLPALINDKGEVVSCWKLNKEEIEKINETGELWVSVLTFNHPLQPLYFTVNKSDLIIE